MAAPKQEKLEKQEEQQTEREKHAHHQVNGIIGEQVMHLLGEPGDLHRIQVRKLWDDHYRVNVFIGVDASSAKVAHSFFLLTDGSGNIVVSTPAITKQYEPIARRKEAACATP